MLQVALYSPTVSRNGVSVCYVVGGLVWSLCCNNYHLKLEAPSFDEHTCVGAIPYVPVSSMGVGEEGICGETIGIPDQTPAHMHHTHTHSRTHMHTRTHTHAHAHTHTGVALRTRSCMLSWVGKSSLQILRSTWSGRSRWSVMVMS